MKTSRILLSFLILIMGSSVYAQRSYVTGQGDMMFTLSNYTGPGDTGRTIVRFSAFPNLEFAYNVDGNGIFGAYIGLGLQNHGLIWDDGQRHKRRALSISVPVGLKFGDHENNKFFMIGGQIEYLFHYKRKDWNSVSSSNTKVKQSSWLSDAVNPVQPSVHLGICRSNLFIRLKYYPLNFFNNEFTTSQGILPYAGSQSNIFALGICLRNILAGDGHNSDADDNLPDGLDFGLLDR